MMVRDLLACAILCLLASGYALGQGLFAKLKDTEDGAFDLSDFLLSHTGFLPVPIISREQRESFITADSSSIRELAGIPSGIGTRTPSCSKTRARSTSRRAARRGSRTSAPPA